ncbi:MAG: hypothetical protein R8M45_00975 [Ghiorsea sp.]
MNHLRNIILPLLVLLCSISFLTPASAVEFDVQLEQTAWHYKEFEKDTSRFPNTLPSSAQGLGALAKLRLSTDRDLDYFLALGASLMDSTAWAKETWDITQTNDLSIKQQDVRLDMQCRLLGARWGMWLSQRVQTQQRRNFYLSNVLTPLKNEPIPEVITSNWVGLSIASVGGEQGQFEAKIDVAIPLDVEVTNPLFAKSFTKKDGKRAGVHFRLLLPKQTAGVAGLNLTLRFEYPELGGETQASGDFWPYNRWLMASAGMLYAW